jgi:hypothetical protein
VLARVALGTLAVVVIAWLAVLLRDVRLQERAAAGSRDRTSEVALVGIADDLRAARLLNPDREPDLTRAVVENALGRRARAIELIEAVTRAEPENVLAWELLALYARDPAAVRRARAARNRLDPLGAPG